MNSISQNSIIIFVSLGVALSCGSPVKPASEALAVGSHNALILQADFAGLVMTGVARSVSQDIEIYNVRPLIPLYDIKSASDSLAYNAQTWPEGTVFVSVVDPGVGTKRKSVVLETNNHLYFVSPDNGSLSGPAEKYGISAVREIDERVNRRAGSDWAHTFHGRDVYAYTGARLAAGVISFEEVGPILDAAVLQLDTLKATYNEGIYQGFVSGGTGRLGNITLSIDRHLFAEGKPSYGDIFAVKISHKDKTVLRQNIPYAKSFGSVAVGENLLFVDSSGNVSLAINQGNFAAAHGVDSGSDWLISLQRIEN